MRWSRDEQCREQEWPAHRMASILIFYSIPGELCRAGIQRNPSAVFISCSTVNQ
jgi:hypothetical protein